MALPSPLSVFAVELLQVAGWVGAGEGAEGALEAELAAADAQLAFLEGLHDDLIAGVQSGLLEDGDRDRHLVLGGNLGYAFTLAVKEPFRACAWPCDGRSPGMAPVTLRGAPTSEDEEVTRKGEAPAASRGIRAGWVVGPLPARRCRGMRWPTGSRGR